MRAVQHLLAQCNLAGLICAATLLLKLLVPIGYMIADVSGRVAITICSDTEPATMAMDMPRIHGNVADYGKSKDHGKAEQPCAFSDLSASMTGAVDLIQLAALIVFIMAGVVGTPLPTPAGPSYLRPPLRGPPATL